jgi:hypothetical protein
MPNRLGKRSPIPRNAPAHAPNGRSISGLCGRHDWTTYDQGQPVGRIYEDTSSGHSDSTTARISSERASAAGSICRSIDDERITGHLDRQPPTVLLWNATTILAELEVAKHNQDSEKEPSLGVIDALGVNGCAVAFQQLSILVRRYSGMSIQFNFTPELHLVDGRIIRNIEDAIAFAREQEARPGVDRRDEVLHALERARGREEAHAAAHLFLRWLEELEIVD